MVANSYTIECSKGRLSRRTVSAYVILYSANNHLLQGNANTGTAVEPNNGQDGPTLLTVDGANHTGSTDTG